MNNLLILKDNTITFTLEISTLFGNVVRKMSMESLYTPYGLLIPLNGLAGDALDYAEGKVVDGSTFTNRADAVFINHRGEIYRSLSYGPTLSRNRVIYGMGSVLALSDDIEYPRMFLMAMHLNKNNIEKSMKLMEKVTHLRTRDYITYNISDLVEEINRRGCTKPFEPRPVK